MVWIELLAFAMWLDPLSPHGFTSHGFTPLHLIGLIAFIIVFAYGFTMATFFSAWQFRKLMQPYMEALEPEGRRMYELCLAALRLRVSLDDLHKRAQ